MSEYIKREALRDRFDIPDRDYVIREMISRGLSHDAAEVAAEIVIESMRIVRNEISDFPAADVEPVVRSKWELHGGDDSLDCFWFCNNCGWNIEEESDANKWNRCPHCGAHMMERSGSGE